MINISDKLTNQGNNCVLYLRLSKEDKDKIDKGDESNSIKNQRLMLTDYAIEHGFKIVKIYSDDDESGLYSTRPQFEQLIEDAKLGLFNIVISKSQSRFTRNMEHMEKYLHHDFALMNIRFIGVTDNVDTFDTHGKKTRQINGLVNEWYCEDLSNNIRSIFKAKMKNGQFIGSHCPYGYIKDPKNHNKLIIDEYSANIVRRIYSLYLQGYGKAKIGRILTNDNILIPSEYKTEILKENYHHAKKKNNTKSWCYQTIHSILNNQTYIGNMVQNKCEKISYKDKKKRHLSKDEWIIVEGTHEPIIDKETWDNAQALQKKKTRSVNSDRPASIFSGKMYCHDCNRAMTASYNRWKRNDDGSCIVDGYVCAKYKQAGKSVCSSHLIKINELEDIVLYRINQEIKKVNNSQDINKIESYEFTKKTKQSSDIILAEYKAKLEKIKKYKTKTYENFMDEIISKEEYKSYTKKYDEEEEQINKDIEKLQDTKKKNESLKKDYVQWIEHFKKYHNLTELNRDIILDLIDKIEVYEDHTIEIYFKFKNPIE